MVGKLTFDRIELVSWGDRDGRLGDSIAEARQYVRRFAGLAGVEDLGCGEVGVDCDVSVVEGLDCGVVVRSVCLG